MVRGDLLLGVEFADGRRCSNLPRRREVPRPDEPVLWPWEPERREHGRISRPEVSAAGWFADNAPPPA